jgi:hypothetical protein
MTRLTCTGMWERIQGSDKDELTCQGAGWMWQAARLTWGTSERRHTFVRMGDFAEARPGCSILG